MAHFIGKRNLLLLVSFIISIASARADDHPVTGEAPPLPAQVIKPPPIPPSEQAPSPTPSPSPPAELAKFKSAVEPVYLAVVDPIEKSEFESKILPTIKSNLSNCRHCEVVNLTPYDGKGQFYPSDLSAKVDSAPRKDAVLVFLWNRKFRKGEDEGLVEKVKVLVKNGVVVVAAAGRPGTNEATLMISRTLWGQIPEVLIVGDLEDRERLAAGTFFGPELITALRPIVGFEGNDRGALPFGIRIANQFKSRPPLQWQASLREKKSKFRQFWPTLVDFFGR